MLAMVMLVAAVVAGAPARAQTVYKCTQDGKISYGDQPCRSGASVVMPAPAAPQVSAQDKATLSRQAREVARMETEQRKEIALAGRNRERASRAAAAQDKKCAALQLNRKWAAEDARAASQQQAAQAALANLKARRAAEKLAVECPA